MTWRHVACIVGALCLPVLCGLSSTCGTASLKDIIGLSGLVIAAVMGNATTTTSPKPRHDEHTK